LNIYALVPLLSVLVFAGLWALSVRHPSRRERRAFSLYLIAAGLWSFVSFLVHLDEPFLTQYTFLGSRVLMVAIVWMVVTYLHFVRVFANKPAGLGVWLGVAFILAASILAGLGFLPESAYAQGGVLYIDHGASLYFLASAALFMGGWAAITLVQHYREVTSPTARTRITYLMVGFSIVTMGLLTNLSDALVKYPVDHLANLLNAIIIAYVIQRHRLFEIRVVVHRSLVYFVLTALFTAAYLFALFGLQALFHDLTGRPSLLLAALLAVGMALLFAPLRNFTQEQVGRLIYGEAHRYRKLLLSFSNRMSGVLNLEELAQGMLQPVMSVMRPQWAGLLFPDPLSGDFRLQFSEGQKPSEDGTEMRFRRDNPLLSWLAEEGRAMRIEMLDVLVQAQALWLEERNNVDYLDLLCPIVCRGNLTGILALGVKQADVPYTEEEVEMLMTMCNGAAVVAENARTLDSLRHQQRRAELLLTQVVAAQEEERQRIASDLHDSVAQWLVSASYQAQVCITLLSQHKDEELHNDLTAIEETLQASIKELRQVLAGLRPPALEEMGLTHAIRQDMDRLKAEGMSCSFEVEGTVVRLPISAEIAAFRTAQETLTNVSKHAQATEVSLKLDFKDDELLIGIRDNGCGFDVSRALEGAVSVGHMGLLGIKQRVDALGGVLQITSDRASGTKVEISMPIQAVSE